MCMEMYSTIIRPCEITFLVSTTIIYSWAGKYNELWSSIPSLNTLQLQKTPLYGSKLLRDNYWASKTSLHLILIAPVTLRVRYVGGNIKPREFFFYNKQKSNQFWIISIFAVVCPSPILRDSLAIVLHSFDIDWVYDVLKFTVAFEMTMLNIYEVFGASKLYCYLVHFWLSFEK